MNESRYDGSWWYDGSRWYSNSSSRSGIYVKRYRDGMTVNSRRYDGSRWYDVGLLSFQSGI
ncbi:hypothetical protein [Wolbachia endosymbiont (group A) of Epistrophe grossularia]|uniref:hypothetical protein n=1 Tax=Wolbachia endosymbiont (group A) of Epistrophe grossularia TaxID=2954008 RepID=UPI0022308719|nr:hypothetical protein [Wolbachia endosymbiont (group A) of Epistrophe grossularia]